MVAHVRGRMLAASVLVLLLAPSLPFTSAQTEDVVGQAAFHLRVDQGRAIVNQSGTGVGVHFLDGNKTFDVAFPVFNDGRSASPTTGLPVYYWFHQNDTAMDCTRVPAVPAAQQRPNGGTTPGERWVQLTGLRLPIDAVDPGTTAERVRNEYHLKLLVNREPNATQAGFTGASKQQAFRDLCGSVNVGQRPTPGAVPPYNDWDARDNVMIVHLIKDLKMDLKVKSIAWCRGPGVTAAVTPTGTTFARAPCNTNMQMPGGFVYNSTRQNETAREPRVVQNTVDAGEGFEVENRTFFEVEITNDVGTADAPGNATWTGSDRNHSTCPLTTINDEGHHRWYDVNVSIGSSSCKGFRTDLEIKVMRPAGSALPVIDLTNSSDQPQGLGKYRSLPFSLIDWMGPFKVVATVNTIPTNTDPAKAGMLETVSNNNALEQEHEIAWVDLVPGFVLSTLRTSPSSPYAYPSIGQQIRLEGIVEMRNLGTAAPSLFRQSDKNADGTPVNPEGIPQYRPIGWRVSLDNKTTKEFAKQFNTSVVKNASEQAIDPWQENFTFFLNTNPQLPEYISPGKHNLCLEVDVGAPRSEADPVMTTQREVNETNNKACVALYFADNSAPRFIDLEGAVRPKISYGNYKDAPISSMFSNETIRVYANATDDDPTSLRLEASFKLDGQNVWRNYTMEKHASLPALFSVGIDNFNFTAPGNASENWTLAVTARDAFGNEETAPTLPLQVKRWPIQAKNASALVLGIPNGDGYHRDGVAFNYSMDQPIRFELEVFENETGFADQTNITDNFAIWAYPADGKPVKENGSKFQKRISCVTSELPDLKGPKADPCTDKNRFFTPYIERSLGKPGLWYVHIQVTDKGGDVRTINRSFLLRDQLPTLDNYSISQTELEAGQSLIVKVNMTDDFRVEVKDGGALVNFTRTKDNKTFSFPLKNETPTPLDGVRTHHSFTDTVTTGFGRMLDEAGDYLVTFVARDDKGNWNNTPGIPFKLNDTQAPVLIDATVDQPLQEIGFNVTFRATVSDQTNVTVQLRVRPAGSDEDIVRVNLTPTAPGSSNYTYTTNFSTEGSYVWSIFARDSADLLSSVKTGPLSIANNLGPRFEIRQPSTLIDGNRYGRATPQISLLVYDTDGVDKNTITLRVGGVNVTPEAPVPAPHGTKGYIMNYAVPASARFHHRDTVTVNATALDNSSKQLAGSLNFTFIVDDQAPTARVKDFTPRYRAEERHVTWNVSLRTLFSLEAEDNDGLPTGVEAIRYRIFGGGSAAETVYTGPFSMADTPGVYTSKVYQIQFWAVDAVGNVNRTGGRESYETLTVYVDDAPPALDPFGSLPQGRFINATFVDDRSGTDRASVWYTVNGGAFTPIPLDFVAGVWMTVLPEGKKGDRVSYYLEAFDRVGNRETFGNSTEPYASYIVGNHLPKLRITAPTEGSRIARTVDLTWDASDEDGDSLVFTLYYKAPGRTTFVELAKLESPDARRYPLDTSKYPDGQYTFRVAATDGSFVAISETTVSILNRAAAFGAVSPLPGEVDLGQDVLLRVEVTKAQATVEARVYRDGKFVAAYPMNDEGRDGDEVANDGKYSTTVKMDGAGKYSVEFFSTYQEDGVRKESTLKGGDFVVEGSALDVLRESGIWLVAIGLLAAVGVGIAAFVVLRRR